MDRFELIELDEAAVTAPVAPVAAVVPAVPSVIVSEEITETPRALALMEQSGLAWDPVPAPLVVGGREVPASMGRAIVRSDNQDVIGIVGARYTVAGHRQSAPLIDAVAGKLAVKSMRAGLLDNGAKVYAQIECAARMVGGIDVASWLTLATSHDGSSCYAIGFTDTVIVCRNTHARATRDCGLRLRHTASVTGILDNATKIAEAAHEHAEQWDNETLSLMRRGFSGEQMTALASALVPGDSTRAENQRAAILRAYRYSPGAMPGTAWGAAQAVTWWTTHEISARGQDREINLQNGIGKGADVQADAWWHLSTEEGEKALQTVKLYRC